MIFDFIECSPYLNRFLLGMNYSNFELVITSAAVQPRGSTSNVKNQVSNESDNLKGLNSGDTALVQKLKEHVVKGNTLYIIDFEKDLQLGFKNGQIALAYEFRRKLTKEEQENLPTQAGEEEEETQLNSSKDSVCHYRGIAAFNFNTHTKFLLNMINSKSSGYVWKDTEKYEEPKSGDEEDGPQHRQAQVNEDKGGFIYNGMVMENENFEDFKIKQGQFKKSDLVMEYEVGEAGDIKFTRREVPKN